MTTNMNVWCAENARKGYIDSAETNAVALTPTRGPVRTASCQEYQRRALAQQPENIKLGRHVDALQQCIHVLLTSAWDAHHATERVMTIV